MAIEEGADDAAVENAGKCFVVGLCFPFRDHSIFLRETSYLQSFCIRRTAAEARVMRSIFFLETGLSHERDVMQEGRKGKGKPLLWDFLC